MYIAAQDLTPVRIADAPLAAVRLLALLQACGPATKADLRAMSGMARGAFGRAMRQAVALGLVEEAPVTSLFDPANPNSPPTHHESGPAPASHDESHPFLLTRRESETAPVTHHESPATSLRNSVNVPVTVNVDVPEGRLHNTVTGTRSESDPRFKEAWAHAQAALALQLTAAEYDTLVDPVRVHSGADGELQLLVPNSVARDLLGNRLRPWLKEHLAQLLGEYVDVHLILDTGAAAVVEPKPDLIEAIVAVGVWRHTAERLLREAGPELCRRQLEALEHYRSHSHIRNEAGWFVRSVREQWEFGA